MEVNENIIEVSGLKKYYAVGGNTVKALDGVDFTVKRGEFVFIMGRSGSGKSTLLNMLAGLESPTEGTVEINGLAVDRMSERARIRFRSENIGFVFQSYNLMHQYTTLENVALPLAIRGAPHKIRCELAEEALVRVGLKDYIKHKPSELSGGEQQRVGLARAIISRPPIVLADEPTGNLDTKTGREVMDLITEIFKETQTTFLLVSHDPGMECYTDKTIHLQDGKLCDMV